MAPDARSQMCSITPSINGISELHKQLGHPGYARLYHFVKSRNLPYTSEATKEACRTCKTCSVVKPLFYKPPVGKLIKATHAFQRLSMDFKGPVKGRNHNILVIVDDYSGYPFVFACRDLTAKTVVKCLKSLFVMFGFPSYIHSDRASTFLSQELKQFFSSLNIASSHSTPITLKKILNVKELIRLNSARLSYSFMRKTYLKTVGKTFFLKHFIVYDRQCVYPLMQRLMNECSNFPDEL